MDFEAEIRELDADMDHIIGNVKHESWQGHYISAIETRQVKLDMAI